MTTPPVIGANIHASDDDPDETSPSSPPANPLTCVFVPVIAAAIPLEQRLRCPNDTRRRPCHHHDQTLSSSASRPGPGPGPGPTTTSPPHPRRSAATARRCFTSSASSTPRDGTGRPAPASCITRLSRFPLELGTTSADLPGLAMRRISRRRSPLPSSATGEEPAHALDNECVVLQLRQPRHGDRADHPGAADAHGERAAVGGEQTGIEAVALLEGALREPVLPAGHEN